MDYSNHTVTDFLIDEHFQSWIKKPDAENSSFWEVFLLKHPEKASSILEARQILLQLNFEGKKLPEEKIKLIWKNIFAAISDREIIPTSYWAIKEKQIPNINRWMVAAASVAVLLLSFGSYLLFDYNQYVHISTNYGEKRLILLPDGSQATLNANSKLSYLKNWTKQPDRIVWLNGEAFFDVTEQHESKQAKFIVNTDAINVEVLGTQFNVSERKYQTEVTLNRGKIKLNLKKENSYNEKDLTLLPGERVEVKEASNQIEFKKMKVNPDNYISWVKNHWLLEKTSLKEVAERIKNTFGVEVEIIEPHLGDETMSGVLPIQDINHLLEVLSFTYSVKIQTKENHITISK